VDPNVERTVKGQRTCCRRPIYQNQDVDCPIASLFKEGKMRACITDVSRSDAKK